MSIQEILNRTEHRPWELPTRSWDFYQEWNNVCFLHWCVDLNELKKFVPSQLQIDLFEGNPWVSLVAFRMEKIRPRYWPSFSPISNFNEINIRTYVNSNSKAGVYFLSIEGGNALACKVAKKISGLPYRFSKITSNNNRYRSSNSGFKDELVFSFKIGNEIENKKPIDTWLTEKYILFQDTTTCIDEFEIHHIEWPMRNIEAHHLELNYPRFKNLIKNAPDKIHYSNGVEPELCIRKSITA